MYTSSPQQQQGAVLIIGMLMLITLTVLGVTAMRNMTLEERIAASYQRSETGFHITESAVSAVAWLGSQDITNYGPPGSPTSIQNSQYLEANDPFITSLNQCLTPLTVAPAGFSFDPANVLNNPGLAVNTSLTYLGWNRSPRLVRGFQSSVDSNAYGGYLFSVTVAASMGTTSHASSDTNQQLMYLVRPIPDGPCFFAAPAPLTPPPAA